MSSEVRLGMITGVCAYVLWGILPLYIKFLGHIAPPDILAHRIFWSVPTGLILIAIAGKWREFFAVLKSRNALWLMLSAALISINWLTYIWAVNDDRVMEASLGYYINPLINVLVGAVFLSETLRRWQWVAIGIAAIAVTVETFALGHVPWVSLVLCFSFAAYSFIRRNVQVDSRVGFTLEVLVLLPLVVIWFGVDLSHGGEAFGRGIGDVLLLSIAGPFTAIPLILFALSAKRLRFSTVGILQYLGPSIQFLIALALGEQLTLLRGATFILIWMALVIFSVDAIQNERKIRKARIAPV